MIAQRCRGFNAGHPEDVYLLARAYYLGRQAKRAVLLLRAHGLLALVSDADGLRGLAKQKEPRFQYLGALCYVRSECAVLIVFVL